MIYKLLKDAQNDSVYNSKAGDTVYESNSYDYGLARNDTLITGKKHISVKVSLEDSFQFTVPFEDLELLDYSEKNNE